MYNLFLLNEIYTNGYRIEVLDVISLVAVLCSILVIISKNPIVSVLFLIGLFLSIASYLMILGLNFIGLSYLLVYVGAVSILFLFILMLINVRISELLSNTRNSIPLAIFITISFNYPVYQILPYSIASFNSYTVDLNNTLNDIWYNNYSDFFIKLFNLNGAKLDNGEISFVTSRIWDGNLAETSHITSIGNIMYTSYSIWLILTSIILLLAMTGAIVITIKQKNNINNKYSSDNKSKTFNLAVSNKKFYSTSTNINAKLLPNWVTGFSVGESSFLVSISKNNKSSTGWQIVPAFVIELKDIDISLLYKIKEYFGVGKIQIIKKKGHVVYVVNSLKDICSVIIPHFDKYSFYKKDKFFTF